MFFKGRTVVVVEEGVVVVVVVVLGIGVVTENGLGFCVVGDVTITVDFATPPSFRLKLNPTESVALIVFGLG